MYKLIPLVPVISKIQIVQRLSDNVYIPFVPDNTDYQVYLKWLEEGNTPLPADEVTK
jgi:hypothetical protein